jgi:hypothetical protein
MQCDEFVRRIDAPLVVLAANQFLLFLQRQLRILTDRIEIAARNAFAY